MSHRLPLALCLLLPTGLAAQEPGPLSAASIATLDSRIEKARARQGIPGLSVAIALRGRLAYERAFGLADLEHRVPTKLTTRFRTASIAKPMTAVAVMQLHERGKLDLDAPFRTIEPRWPKKRWPLTCRQLLGHLGGIRHYRGGDEATGKAFFMTVGDSLACFDKDPLEHEPGTRYRYTTYGFTLLGLAVERASGLDYARYMKRHVWEPAGMKHTVLDTHYFVVPDRARGYAKLDRRRYDALPAPLRREVAPGDIFNASLHDTSMKVPGGGLLSTASDLARFGLALLSPKLVKPETRALMWTRGKTTAGAATSYGLGFFLGDAGGVRTVSHGGGQAGTSCRLLLRPDDGLVVAVMTNLERAQLGRLVRGIAETALGG